MDCLVGHGEYGSRPMTRTYYRNQASVATSSSTPTARTHDSHTPRVTQNASDNGSSRSNCISDM